MVAFVLWVINEIANWRWFQKMGREGWEGIIPFYNEYVVFEELYGNGWKFLLLLIPFYNIYLIIKRNIDLAHAFNKGTGFGIGLLLLPYVFTLILAFGGAEYRDGARSRIGADALSRKLDDLSEKVSGTAEKPVADRLRELDELHKSGILTDAEYEAKRAELVKKL